MCQLLNLPFSSQRGLAGMKQQRRGIDERWEKPVALHRLSTPYISSFMRQMVQGHAEQAELQALLLLDDRIQQLRTSQTPPWNCPATSLTQRWVYSMGLAIGLCVRNCCGRKHGSPAPTRPCQSWVQLYPRGTRRVQSMTERETLSPGTVSKLLGSDTYQHRI